MFAGLATIFATLGLAHLQVLSQPRMFTGTCDEHLPLKEYGSFDTLSADGLVVHAYNPPDDLFRVRIMNVSLVCEANGERRNTVSAFASVVEFECSGSLCPSRIVTELFHLDCRTSGSFIPYSNQFDIRTPSSNTTATLSTPLAKQCGACRPPTSVVRADPETHCVPCHEDCVGLGLCLGSDPINCCNYYYEDNCVVSCPGCLIPNLLFECGCGELTINRVRVAYSDSQFVGSVATLTCDTGNGFEFAANGIVFSDENSEQRTCTLNQGWTLSGSISIICIPRVFLEYPAVPTSALIGTQIVLTCRVTTEYRVVWIVEIPGIGRLETSDSIAVSDLRDVGFVTVTTSAQNRENPLTITGSLRTNQATVQCAAVSIFRRFVFETLITVQFFSPPLNLTVTENGVSSLILSWSAQNVEGLSYTVIITNVNDSSIEPMEVRRIWDHQYTFTHDTTSCDLYMFQVKSVNSEGIESPSEVITSGLPSLPSAPLVYQYMTSGKLNVLQVTIDFATPCQYYPPHNYTLVLRDAAGNITNLTKDYPTFGNTTVEVDIPNLEEGVQYSLYVVVTNQVGESAKSATVALSISSDRLSMDIPIIGTTVPVVLLLGALIIIIIVRIHIAYRHRNKKGANIMGREMMD